MDPHVFVIFHIRIATRYAAMGATDVVNAITKDNLTDAQREALVAFLKTRKAALEESIKEIDKAMSNLGEGEPDHS
jgi:uncharacterized protein YgbK (DUF1537 family)